MEDILWSLWKEATAPPWATPCGGSCCPPCLALPRRPSGIAGVQHEFSTIPGVKEDVTEIVLNIKNLTAKLFCDGPKTVVIDAAGECEVTADSITTDSEVEILNPGMHIATLGAGAKLYMELTLDRGRGYVPAERNKQIQSATGRLSWE